jgi:hypothetical protein
MRPKTAITTDKGQGVDGFITSFFIPAKRAKLDRG